MSFVDDAMKQRVKLTHRSIANFQQWSSIHQRSIAVEKCTAVRCSRRLPRVVAARHAKSRSLLTSLQFRSSLGTTKCYQHRSAICAAFYGHNSLELSEPRKGLPLYLEDDDMYICFMSSKISMDICIK